MPRSDAFTPPFSVLFTLHLFFNAASVDLHASDEKVSPLFIRCVDASDSSVLRLHTVIGARDLDPVTCSVRCLHQGYQVAALTFESCYCGNHQLHGSVHSECLNTSSSGGSNVRGKSERQSVSVSPAGGGHGTVAVYRGEGPFLHRVSDRVQAGKTFVVIVSGNLAECPHQPTGVQIYAAKTAYPTNTDISFLAVADAPGPVEFIWHFGDSTSARTTSRTITKRYHKPGRFDVVVMMSAGQTSITSQVFPLVVQRAVKLSRLVHQVSVLHNQTVTVSCRVSVGTDLTFHWCFGDGSCRHGGGTEQHVFHRTGEFRVEVTVSNRVSTASLSSHIFVVDRPCQPPPVKNMGPLKLQVRRYEVISLGVTYETEMDCDVSGGLQYTWTLFDSAGRTFPLPLTDTHRQSLTLQSHLLQYDTYTAIARVQVIGSVVYSNYSVSVQVVPSPPVAFIQGGTNIFTNNRNTTVLTLDGQRSYDLDFPMNRLSFSWTCKPLSSIATSCFDQHVSLSSSVLVFPVRFLKANFDQFQFTLTIHSRERSASSDTFITVTQNLPGKVSVHCPHCHEDQVTWDQPFSVTTLCEDCDVSPQRIQYTWSLYLVNASSRPVIEVSFCYTMDLSAPSNIIEGPAISPETTVTSTLHPSHTNTSNYTHTVSTPAALLLPETASETTAKELRLGLTDSGTSPSTVSAPVITRTTASEEEPLYNSLDELDLPEHHPSTEYPPLTTDDSSTLHSEQLGQSGIITEVPIHSSADWEFAFPVLGSGDMEGDLAESVADSDYDAPFPAAEEGDPGSSIGRPTGVDVDVFSPGVDSGVDLSVHEDESSNLVVSRPSVVTQETTLLDLPRAPVDRDVFESYTYTGISSSVLSVRPFSLKPGSRYMLEVTARSQRGLVGRTQLFLKSKPAPEGMRCQVQPVKGMELLTHFGIFCSSGKEDLLYKYSFSVGHNIPRVLYQGRDFQFYFNLPSGDPSDDYKVTIYIEIRSSTYGTATKPCSVTVQVQPSFLRDTSSHRDPALELSGAGLRNLSALLELGNTREIRNYICLLSSVVNRLSLDTQANTHAQRHTRNALICTVCELESGEQASMMDSISILKGLLQVTNQVTLASVRQVTAYIQAIADLVPVRYHLDSKTLSALVALLSDNLQAAVTNHELDMDDIPHVLESGPPTGENMRNTTASPNSCIPAPFTGDLTKRMTWLVTDILQIASDLMLKYILFHKVQQHRVSTGLIAISTSHHNQTSTVVSSGSTTFYMSDSLIRLLFAQHGVTTESRQHQPCVLCVLTELAHNPYTYTYTHRPTQLSGPVVDLSLYKCSTRRKIPVRSLVLPITTELQQPMRNPSSVHEYTFHHNQVSYHCFNITPDHLQQAIQLSVVFTPPTNKVFPIMLLLRMFERPTPSMHHLHRIHRWESNSIHISLPPSYFNAAGAAHLALLNADFGKVPRRMHLNEQIGYSLRVVSSRCLSWDSYQGTWTHQGCRTQQADTNTAVNCSCYQLRPLTVLQHQIQSSHDTANLDPFLSVSQDLTVLIVLALCVCLCIPGLVACKKVDDISEPNRRAHYLSDNSPFDQYLYAVTIHTGLCSAASMSAKVYIVLYGEDGFSHTKELQVPGCTLFRRNSQDTFLLRAADSLGPLFGVHIWHDSSGPSPSWYLQHVEVSEVNRGQERGRAWLFVGQCWLAADKDDGQVERMLYVCTRGIGFTKMLCFKLSNLMADFHIWMSVYCCPCPNLFTHVQRLSMCLLLLLGYACVNTVIISQMDDQSPFELGILDVSAVSVTTGVLSVVAVLPGATMISFLFRLQDVKMRRSRVQCAKFRNAERDCFGDARPVNDSAFDVSWRSLKQWIEEVWRKKYQQGTDLLSVSSMILENKDTDKETENRPEVIIKDEDDRVFGSSVRSQTLRENSLFSGTQKSLLSGVNEEDQSIQKRRVNGKRVGVTSQWWHYLAWALCLLLSLSCLTLSAVLGMRFSSSKVLLWIHSLFFSITSCVFFIHPLVIITVAVTVSFWYRNTADFHTFSTIKEFEIGANQPEEQLRPSAFPQETCPYPEKLLADRRRARYLRLVRPPTPAELRRTRGRKKRETLIRNTLRDLLVCISMFFLMLCVTYGSSFSDHCQLNAAVRKHFIRNNDDNDFLSVRRHEDWWEWTHTRLLNMLYKNASDKPEQPYILIGEPILWKKESSSLFQQQASSVTLLQECLRSFLSGSRTSTYPHSIVTVPMATPPRTHGRMGSHLATSVTVGLGHTKSDAASKLSLLHSAGWLGEQTVAVKVQFTLYSHAPNLFTSVTLLTEQSPTSVLVPSFKVQSVRVYHTPTLWDYVVMVCQLIFLILSLLQLCLHVCTVKQQGLRRYWRTLSNWIEVTLLTVTLVHSFYYIYHSVLIMDAVGLLQRHKGHVDVSSLASWEQNIHTLRGVILFLLAIKCVSVLRANTTLASSVALLTRSLSCLLWPTISGLILLVALSCGGNLLFIQSSLAFSSIPRSLQTLLHHYWGFKPIRSLLFSGHNSLYCKTLYLTFTVMWTAVVIGVASSLVRSARRSQSRRNVFTAAELFVYIRQCVTEFTGQRKPRWTDNPVESRSYHLEEFESLVDELLFRLNALSDSLHHTLPTKLHHYMEESPIDSPIQALHNNDSQDFERREETIRSKLELESVKALQLRGPWRNSSPSDSAVASENMQQSGKRDGGHRNDGELRPFSKGQNQQSLPQSASLISIWTEDVLGKHADRWTKTNDSCWISKAQASRSEMLVEVLVHEDPGNVEPNIQEGPSGSIWDTVSN